MVVDANTDVAKALRELRSALGELTKRIALLEGDEKQAEAVATKAPVAAAAPLAPVQEVIPEEILLIISAAVAAYLGERPSIRQIRLISSPEWAHQGRVFIQASHNLAR
jgi:hypothetical protein